MLSKRIIPCLDVRNGKLTKGVKFQGNVDIGDPVETARMYYEQGADEIVFYDITASSEGRGIFLDVVERVASQIFIPFSVVLTRVNSMVTTRAMQVVKTLLAERRVHVLDTPIIERSAFRDIFDCGGTLYSADPGRVSNLAKARENASAFANEVIESLETRVRFQIPTPGAAASIRTAA